MELSSLELDRVKQIAVTKMFKYSPINGRACRIMWLLVLMVHLMLGSLCAATCTGTTKIGYTKKDTTTMVEFAGHDKTPIVILDNVLSKSAYISFRDDLRSRQNMEYDGIFLKATITQ